MKTVFFVHQAGAGAHAVETMLGAAFGDTLRICAFKRDAACCGTIPCKRTAEFDRAGYRLFLLKDTDGTALRPSGEASLVLLREPTLRALTSYGRDLAERGKGHSIELLQAWLSADAIRAIDFHKSWGGPAARRSVVRYEAFASAPREALEGVLTDLGVPLDNDALARMAPVTDGGALDVSPAALESDTNFIRLLFAEYMNLLTEEASYLGYPAWTEVKPASGPVTTLYRARRARREGNFEEVAALLTPFVAVHAVEPEIRVLLAEALLETGRELEGRRALDIVFKAQPEHFEAHAALARHAYRQGLATEGRAILREAIARRGGPAWTRKFLAASKLDAELLGELPAEVEPPVLRGAVIDGFSWILGRVPESEAVIEGHRRLHDDDDLRGSLLRSEEFRNFHNRFEAGEEGVPAEHSAAPSREDVLAALHWLLGRPLRSREEADALLTAHSREELRLMLVGGDEFRAAYGHVTAGG